MARNVVNQDRLPLHQKLASQFWDGRPRFRDCQGVAGSFQAFVDGTAGR